MNTYHNDRVEREANEMLDILRELVEAEAELRRGAAKGETVIRMSAAFERARDFLTAFDRSAAR